MPSMMLPEVRDPKHWWGGHIWADNAKRYVYSFTAYMTETIWYNTTLVKPEEIASWDSLLDPKWKGKIVILDPRSPGSGESNWAFSAENQGRTISRQARRSRDDGRAQSSPAGRTGGARQVVDFDRRLLLHVLAVHQSRAAGQVNLEYQRGLLRRHRKRQFSGAEKCTLIPMPPRYSSTGCSPRKGRPRSTKALGQPTRRFDVDTKWTREFGHPSAKEVLTPEKFDELENGSEEVVLKYRKPAMHLGGEVVQVVGGTGIWVL